MRSLKIRNRENTLQASILPDYGGMISELIYKEKRIISCYEDNVHLSALLSCGSPILFPFAGRVANDLYQVNGKDYYMPFHGLVKESAFGIKEISANRAILWTDISGANLTDHYPFACRLEITYELLDNRLRCVAGIINDSETVLFHSFGWHPFFVASKKDKFHLTVNMKEYMDWKTKTTSSCPEDMKFGNEEDLVFTGRTDGCLRIQNFADAYEAVIETPPCYKAVVVCSTFENRVCVEPWIGPPDAVHMSGYLEYVKPEERCDYPMVITLKEV